MFSKHGIVTHTAEHRASVSVARMATKRSYRYGLSFTVLWVVPYGELGGCVADVDDARSLHNCWHAARVYLTGPPSKKLMMALCETILNCPRDKNTCLTPAGERWQIVTTGLARHAWEVVDHRDDHKWMLR